MLIGTKFGDIHSGTDLHLVPETLLISPAEPKLNLVEIPYGNGSVDLTEALGLGVTYNDRKIKWTFTLYPGDNWPERQSIVSNAINGKRLHITPDDDPGWYYDGRITVKKHKTDKLYHQITVEATCAPYKRKITESTASASLGTEYTDISCEIGAMPLVPKITVEQDTMIQWGEYSASVSAGSHFLPELLMQGNQVIKAKVAAGTGTITITWREGSL